MNDREEAFGILGLTVVGAQLIEKNIIYLLVHLTFEQEAIPSSLAEVYERLDEPLGALITIWKKYGMSYEWQTKMEEVRQKRNWIAHKCATDRWYLLNANPAAFTAELEEYLHLFRATNAELEKLVEEKVHEICKKRGINHSKLKAFAEQRVAEIMTSRMPDNSK